MMKVVEFLENTFSDGSFSTRDRVECKDGFNISIQGGTTSHYCVPRENCNIYHKVELGFPSSSDELITEYAEDRDDLTGTVYGYVPIEVVEKLIEKHGGIK